MGRRTVEAIRLPLEMANRPEGPAIISYIPEGKEVFLEYTKFRDDGLAIRKTTLSESTIVSPTLRHIRRRRVWRNVTSADTNQGIVLSEGTTFTTRNKSVKKTTIK